MRYLAAAVQTDLPNPTSRAELPERVSKLLSHIDHAAVGYAPFGDVRLVAFPEFAHAAPVYATAEELSDKLAVPVPNDHTDRYAAKAKEHGLYVQTGSLLEKDTRWPGQVFNTTCLVGPDGLLVQVPQGEPVAAVGGPRQPARPAGVRRPAVSRSRKPRSASSGRRFATTGCSPRRSASWPCRGPRCWCG